MSWYLTFNEDLPNWGTYFVGFVSPDEPSNLRNTGPMREADQDLGLYSVQLEKARAEAFLRALESSGYPALVSAAPVPPETPMLTVGRGERTVNAPPVLCGFDLPGLPAAMIPVREAIHAMAREIRGHPRHVVRGRAAWSQPTFKPRGPIQATLTLSNPGPEPVEIRSPDAPDDPAIVILTLGLAGAEPQQVQLAPRDIVRVDAQQKKLPPSDTMALAPGEEAHFRLEKKVYLGAGSYRGTVTLRMLDEDGAPPERAHGVLLAKAGGFDVKGWW